MLALWVVATIVVANWVLAQEVPGNPVQPSLETVKGETATAVYVVNPLFAPISAGFEISGNNIQTDRGNSFSRVFPARSRTLAFNVGPSDSQGAWNWEYQWQWVMGSINAVHQNVVYDLPLAQGKAFLLMQGYGGKFSHNTPEHFYALDFEMPESTPVYAAREGTVVAVETSYTVGGTDPSLEDKANYVSVLHSDGTFSQYVHLRPNGSAVKVGQSVKRGQLIGYSGNTGFSSGPHLHFQVFKAGSFEMPSQPLPTRFRTSAGVLQPTEGKRYTRP